MYIVHLLFIKVKIDTRPIIRSNFGNIVGVPVCIYHINFPGQLEAKLTNYGGILCSLKVPNRNGDLENVVLGYDDLEEYLKDEYYLGAVIGRYGNRIASGTFSLNSKQYQLTKNLGDNHLHGGEMGFNSKIWKEVSIKDNTDEKVLTFLCTSRDGEEGYSGNLMTSINYIFTANSFEITYEATSDADTILNLTHHSYFNLSGNPKQSIEDHQLSLNSEYFLEIDIDFLPTGKLIPVQNTPFDFIQTKIVGSNIGKEHEQLRRAGGYDHCFVLQRDSSKEMTIAGKLEDRFSGRGMCLFTTQPGVQLYTGNFLGPPFKKRAGLCLETQHFPDSPNHNNFPSTLLKKGEVFKSATKHLFYQIGKEL